MRLSIALLLFIYILPVNLFSQDISRKRAVFLADSILNARGEAYIAIPDSRLKAAILLKDKLIFDKHSDSLTYFYLNRESFKKLKESGIDFFYVIPPSLAGNIYMAKSVREVLDGLGYPTYQQYLAIMDSFKKKYPLLCRIDTIGFSKNGKLILSARLHSGNYIPCDKPVLMFSSTIHGDEPLGYTLMLRLLDELLKGYGLYNDYTEMIDETVILINPLSNPDGTYYSADTTIYGAIRQNRNFVDLNRSFPERIYGDNPQNYNWQPENRAMMLYLWKYKPSLSANFHGGEEVVNYPWDASSTLHPDDQWFRYISKEFADTARKVDKDYMNSSQFPDGITNGYEWYPLYGGRQDYVTYYLNGKEVTIELSLDKIPLSTTLSFYWFVARKSFINYLKQGLYGIWGVVTDSETGSPVESKIEIPGHDKLNSFISSDKTTGKFFRYLYEGNYDLHLSPDGYLAKNVNDINVNNHQRTNLSIQVISEKSILKDREFLVFPNPFTGKFNFSFKSEIQTDCDLQIYDFNGKLVYTNIFISNAGVNYIEIDLSDKPSGFYTLKLITENKIVRTKIVKAK